MALALTGCGGSHKKKAAPSPSTPTTTPSSPPPTYSADQVKAALLAPADIKKGIHQIKVVLDPLKFDKVPICSLTGFKMPGSPQLTTRQFVNDTLGAEQFQYAQLIARYDDTASATSAYSALNSAASKCPKRRHIPPKKVTENFTIFSHNDTWKVADSTIQSWTHLQGTEQQVYPPDATKFNVYNVFYDYASRGNVVIATMYAQRTAPKASAAPIAQQASTVIQKQLGKFG
ncbi:hypothetical protein [Actinomadura oligospora]|uniref:hypothetical protein n=1 Tax=Actinomadura oligospora TaxID=111804 RepID=UPI000478F722|nr:hypothetical protein [Actinomadura oligospora]